MSEKVKPLAALISGVASALIKATRQLRVQLQAPRMCLYCWQKSDQSELLAATQTHRCVVMNAHTHSDSDELENSQTV